MVKNQRRKKTLRIIAGFVLVLFSNYYIAGQVMKAWEGKNSFRPGESYRGVIVLGGYSSWNTRHQQLEFNESADRLLEAVKLYESGQAKKIILSGGSGMLLKPDEKESAFVRKTLTQIGVYEKNILVEDSSRNTFENAQYTSKLIKRTWPVPGKFILITSAFHMRRAKACFEKTGLDIDYYRVDFQVDDDDYDLGSLLIPSTGAFYTWNMLIKEVLGYTVYWFKNFL
jgi:uncharacterized SAM-binding protein YcdF (DUF218 family)